jgi:ABC-type transport system involved in multi-copper enzyme maturation permease subunit
MNALLIARLTLVETFRRQIHLLTMFLAILIFIVPVFANVFGLGASDRIVKDVGLTLIGYYGLLLSLFFGAAAIPGEIERRTIYPLMTRPLPRRSYLWGKWLGLSLFVLFSMLVLAGSLMLSSWVYLARVDTRILLGLSCEWIEVALVMAIAMFFSTFCSPPLAAVAAMFIYIIGGLPNEFIGFFLVNHGVVTGPAYLTQWMKAVFPHFELFRIKDAVVHGEPLAGMYVCSVLLYGAAWVVLSQLLAEWKFERRDL